MKKVYVGMSGGVDSSLTAALLVEQGYDVTGVYMKNWAQDLPGWACPWREDLADAKRVAVQLGIPFKIYDFQKEYKQKVVDYMIEGYKTGITPNPDIMCNQEIKFKLFLDAALEDGADMIATGHYARRMPLDDSPASSAEPTAPRVSQRSASSAPPVLGHRADKHATLRASTHPRISSEPEAPVGQFGLFMAEDKNKDQTYFLYRVSSKALKQVLFPLGELTKPEVRAEAKKRGLATAEKKESMGICFVGKVDIKDFLQQYVDTKPGAIVNQKGEEIGEHDGAIFYTIGQRHGLDVGGGLPYYVVDKDIDKNIIYVSTDLDDERLWLKEIKLTQPHWINKAPKSDTKLQVRTRHRAPLVNSTVTDANTIKLDDPIRAVTPGQSAVLYDGDRVVGGGVVV